MEIEKNSYCYFFEKKTFNDGLLDETVDATYIINLENNGRYNRIIKQLEKYHPTNIVYIVHNKGYKICEKKLPNNVSYQDLTDAFLQCFKHSDDSRYKNILILEDDFIFDKKIKEKHHITNINNFNKNHENEPYIYKLGVIPYILSPYNLYTYKGFSTGAHCCIYSEKCKKDILLIKEKQIINDWDIYFNIYNKNSYLYYTPLCYQIFQETENRINWGKDINNTFLNSISQYVITLYFHLLGIDKTPQPGYSISYFIAKLFFYILLFIFILLIYFLNKKFQKYKI